MQKAITVLKKGEVFDKWSKVSLFNNQYCIKSIVSHTFPIPSHEAWRNLTEKTNEAT